MAIRIIDSVLPPATTTKKGGVIIGEDLDVTAEGTLTIGGVISEIAGKAGSYLYTDGSKLIWQPLPDTIEVDRLNTDILTNTYLNGNQGVAILNSKAADGAYVTAIKTNSTNGKFTLNTYQDKLLLGYTSNTTINAGTNSLDKQITLMNEAGDSQFPGTITAPVFNGVATQARYADLAEKYLSDEKYPVGTLIKFGGEKEITIADKEVNGVISEKPGFILNSKSKGQSIALIGKVKVRVVGKVKKFNKIVLSKIAGVGCVKKWYDFRKVVAIALEDNDTDAEKLVMCVAKLTF